MIAADDDTEKSMMDMARAERAELAAFLTTLTLQQWETPSLCAGWSVKEVVAHNDQLRRSRRFRVAQALCQRPDRPGQ